jgi:hypothetical protein
MVKVKVRRSSQPKKSMSEYYPIGDPTVSSYLWDTASIASPTAHEEEMLPPSRRSMMRLSLAVHLEYDIASSVIADQP